MERHRFAAVCVACLSLVLATSAGVFGVDTLLASKSHEGLKSSVIHPRLGTWAETAPAGSRVWIRFADRGSAATQQVPLTQRALDRRLRLGISLNTPDRQPVAPEYIEAVRQAGAEIHRVSRWLNAVSVTYNPTLVTRVAQLPYVASVQPVARFKSARPELEAAENRPGPIDPKAAALSYGPSADQIQQIKADVAHTRGYTGAGVLVAMFDTGFRKDHVAFADAVAQGRLVEEWDFVFDDGDTQNEVVDDPAAHNHGTLTWSTLGGTSAGQLYGPAYGASFLLAKTEDIRSETPVEEDNWLAAVEWADSLGADVISSSLTYSDWYSLSDYDGLTAMITQAANLAAELGIVVCNSAGNAGPSPNTIGAPVDGFWVLGIGSVTSTGTISSFSSRGPTADGRIKPEVCARGSATWCATASSTVSFSSASGTSLSCPLVGGAAALIREAHTDWNPLMVREALMQTAGQAQTPDNTYGWGIIDVNAAIDYTSSLGLNFEPLPDTLFFNDSEYRLAIEVLSALTPVDIAQSAVYYRVDGGSYSALPLTAGSGDTLVCQIPQPATVPATVDFYVVAKDSIGFSLRSPELLAETHTFVWWETLHRGDVNRDQLINSADLIFMVNYIFKSGFAPDPLELGEVDGTLPITSTDVIYLVNYVFKSGPAPVE